MMVQRRMTTPRTERQGCIMMFTVLQHNLYTKTSMTRGCETQRANTRTKCCGSGVRVRNMQNFSGKTVCSLKLWSTCARPDCSSSLLWSDHRHVTPLPQRSSKTNRTRVRHCVARQTPSPSSPIVRHLVPVPPPTTFGGPSWPTSPARHECVSAFDSSAPLSSKCA